VIDHSTIIFVLACALTGLIALVVLCVSIIILRREHAHHVHNLWYIFFLTVICYSVLLIYLFDTNGDHTSAMNLFDLYVPFATDVKGEFYLVTGIVVLGILPQVISFIISGIFGCGSPPVLVSTITKITIFSLLKFLCILAGITTGTFVVLQIHPIPVLNDAVYAASLQRHGTTPRETVIFGLLGSLILLSVSFLTSAIYYKVDALYRRIMASSRFRYLNSVLMYMTKYTDGRGSRWQEMTVWRGVSNTAFADPPHVSPDSTSSSRAA
jgi:hypothetical protein